MARTIFVYAVMGIGCALLIAFGISFLDYVAPQRFCGQLPLGACIKDWFTSYAGWAAAIAALLALGPLLQQVVEAKRQSDFTVGDANPEFIVLRNRDKVEVFMEITNYNRRVVIIKPFKLIEPKGYTIQYVTDNASSKAIKPDYRMADWRDRNQPAPRRKLILHFAKDAIEVPTSEVVSKSVTLEIEYRIIGQDHKVHKTKCTAVALTDL